ncbi:MAG: GNAT family N-acetyltransferase [Trueperella sp.]|nr:GNAT family N-acetyltransferase [Trueperella sp.]
MADSAGTPGVPRVPEGFHLITPPQAWWQKIAEFDNENFGVDAWPTGMWRFELEAQGRSYLALVTDPGPIRTEGTLVGLGGISHGPEAELLTIAVSRHVRGRGLGGVLVDALLAISRQHSAESVFLEVRAGDPGARRLYERAGFRSVGLRKNYYRDDDAVIMKLDLVGENRHQPKK